MTWPMPRVWMGTSVETQEYTTRLDHLADTPAYVRWVSAEPLLGPLDLETWLAAGTLDWVVVGGESGPGARDMDPDWARDIRDQCARHGVAFFMKQMSRKAPIPEDLMVRQYPS